MKRWLIVILLCLCASSAQAATYYVTQSGAGERDGLSVGNAWSVADFNAASLSGGDTVTFSGTITGQVTVPSSGSAGNYITINGTATFTGTYEGQLRAYTKSYLIFDGLTFDGAGNTGGTGLVLFNGVSNVIVRNCTFQNFINNTEGGTKNVGIFISSTQRADRQSYITIEDNEFHAIGSDTGDSDVMIAYADDVIYRRNVHTGSNASSEGGIDGLILLSTDNVLVERNSFLNMEENLGSQKGEDGIDLKGAKNIIVRHNIFDGIRVNAINVNMDDPVSLVCSNIVIYANKITDAANAIRVNDLDDKISIWSNLIHEPSSYHGIVFSTSAPQNHYIYNNTIVNFYGSGQYAIYGAGGNDYQIKNNIIYSDDPYRLVRLNTSKVTLSNNLAHYTGGVPYILTSVPSNVTWASVEAGVITTDPSFTSMVGYDYTLGALSPAIDAGTAITGGPASITIQGQVYSFSYDTGLAESTDWTTSPPTVATASRSDYGWDVGAYVYDTSDVSGDPTEPPPTHHGAVLVNAISGAKVNQIASPVINQIRTTVAQDESIAHVATSTYSNSDTSSMTVDKPTGTAEDNVMIAVLVQAGSATITPPSGWTQIYSRWFEPGGSNHMQRAWYKVAGASEPANYTWTLSGKRKVLITISTFSGVQTASPIGNHAVYEDEDSRVEAIAPTINIQAAGNVSFVVASSLYGTTWTTPTGHTEHADIRDNTLSTSISLSVHSKEYTATGATGAITATAADADYHVAAQIELRAKDEI